MLGIRWQNTTLDTEFTRNFCAGIGPLQLGVVLVSSFITIRNENDQLICVTFLVSAGHCVCFSYKLIHARREKT